MIAKIGLFFDLIILPLSWMPDFCLNVINTLIAISGLLCVLFIVIKLAPLFANLGSAISDAFTGGTS